MKQSRIMWITKDGAKGDVPGHNFLWEINPYCDKNGTYLQKDGASIGLCRSEFSHLFPKFALRKKGKRKVKITIENVE